MKTIQTLIHTLLVVPLSVALISCAAVEPPKKMDLGADPDLAAHSDEFRREVIQVTGGIHVAVGFGLANSVLIEGEDGVIIVDTMESAEAAEPVKAAFARITNKPVKAIIYTHFHSDHTLGAKVMAGDDTPVIYAHAGTEKHLKRIATITRETTYRRAMRQFGTLLPEGGLINCGIGPRLVYDGTQTIAMLPPTKVFTGDRLELEIAGVRIVLLHAPGETPDQIVVWLPDKRVLLPADDFYKSFPNLYAIRGTAYRDVMQWVHSLDMMRDLRAHYLVPLHTRPITGEETIFDILTNYRDAIQYVHDQTIRWMNRGLTPDEIVERVKLPEHLARQPYLHEYYGTVPWSVRGIFAGYLGWFGGNAADLFPLAPKERAQRFARLAGGEAALMKAAEDSMKTGDYQWVLELTDQLIRLKPENHEARHLKAQALKALGERQIAATARNYYLTQALEEEGRLEIKMHALKEKDVVHSLAVGDIFKAMAVNLDPVKSAEVDKVAGFRFPDTGEGYTLHVRRGVAEVRPRFPANPDITVTVDAAVWKEIAAGMRSAAGALVKGDVKIEGGTFSLVKFLGLFKDD